jgi:hypothetical protein
MSIQLSNTESLAKNSIRTKSDLTGKYGELLLFEYSEQYPVLLNEIGMFSKIRTYLRPVTTKKMFFLPLNRMNFLATF